MRVFLDANILFSAADAESATRRLLETLRKHAGVVTNPHAVEEARRNLALKRPQFVTFFGRLVERLEITHAFEQNLGVHLPDEDVPILAGAVGSRCTHLWTSDRRHFGRLYGRSVRGCVPISSVMLADLLADEA